LGTGDYIVETRDNNGTLQFRLLDIDGEVIGIDDGAGAMTTAWQDYAGGATIDTGRGLSFTFNAAATDGVQVRVNYTAAGIDMTDAAQVGTFAIDATDSLSTIAQKINNSASLQTYGRGIKAVVVENQLYLVPSEAGSAHAVIANSTLTTAGVTAPDGNIAAGAAVLNFPSGVTVDTPSKFFEGEDNALGPAFAIRLSTDITDSIDNIQASISDATAGDGFIAQALADGRYADNFPIGLIEGTTLYKRENANDTYNVQVTELGLEIKYATTGEEYEGTIADALYTQRESFCGVSLEEEAVNLLKYQKAFQAASRVITAANEMLGRLIDQVAASA
jgi:flagellar hook-associated protein 1 FlgK